MYSPRDKPISRAFLPPRIRKSAGRRIENIWSMASDVESMAWRDSRDMSGSLGLGGMEAASIGRLGSAQSAVCRQLDLVLPAFRDLAFFKPFKNGRLCAAQHAGDFALRAKVV